MIEITQDQIFILNQFHTKEMEKHPRLVQLIRNPATEEWSIRFL